ncbi:hypothetical protein J2805_000227 [Arthrobacter oryzae]|nr:hypothetical protein [Arthrobacter oryzae]
MSARPLSAHDSPPSAHRSLRSESMLPVDVDQRRERVHRARHAHRSNLGGCRRNINWSQARYVIYRGGVAVQVGSAAPAAQVGRVGARHPPLPPTSRSRLRRVHVSRGAPRLREEFVSRETSQPRNGPQLALPECNILPVQPHQHEVWDRNPRLRGTNSALVEPDKNCYWSIQKSEDCSAAPRMARRRARYQLIPFSKQQTTTTTAMSGCSIGMPT